MSVAGPASGVSRGSAILLEAGGIVELLTASMRTLLPGRRRGHRVKLNFMIREFVRAGNRSLPLISLICVLIGMIMALQAARQLAQFGAQELVADLVAVSLTRELAPLLAAVIVAARYGSAIAAELATMRITQEIDAYQVMGVDPVAYLVVPRIVGTLLALPCLQVFASALGILGGWSMAVTVLGLPAGPYLINSLNVLLLPDLILGAVKALLFGMVIGLVSCHCGMRVGGAATQVGEATTAAVVRSIVVAIVVDLFITVLFFRTSGS
jgi:phospholipid/cholesterol/gamma-HCH transport system permease protein